MRSAFWLAGAAMLALAQPAAAGDTIKIGFVSTFSGPTAVIGNDMRNSFELALDHLGHKMGGKKVEVIYEDDTFKPDVGQHTLYSFLTTDPADVVKPNHEKATPLILTTRDEIETWLTAPMDEALKLQQPAKPGVIVLLPFEEKGEDVDGPKAPAKKKKPATG